MTDGTNPKLMTIATTRDKARMVLKALKASVSSPSTISSLSARSLSLKMSAEGQSTERPSRREGGVRASALVALISIGAYGSSRLVMLELIPLTWDGFQRAVFHRLTSTCFVVDMAHISTLAAEIGSVVLLATSRFETAQYISLILFLPMLARKLVSLFEWDNFLQTCILSHDSMVCHHEFRVFPRKGEDLQSGWFREVVLIRRESF
ncbi:uncharacterized protein EV420DRAFT_1482552 [Desarmillaria tabescens]|uniref:Uncharacterized protein n=1 Tax=Armillaria tabescens TaxID=1929756 RepID=A0AA39MY09_ARMTA|nr:uncharacterized protein EV420DRAFT_1482552 [Desarmillaria tabescens]KAK0451141.1 hypothetical protein EV420DRAFT_1482552 [Desarmillaria tabescens]